MIDIREYVTAAGSTPFAEWFAGLDTTAALKVQTALARMESGNLANSKSVGGGVREFRIDFGPGYRIYYGQAGLQLVILLAGGTKKRQQKDITRAKDLWKDFKKRKKEGT